MTTTKQTTRAGMLKRAKSNGHNMGRFTKTEALRLNTLSETGSEYSSIHVSRCKDCDAPMYYSAGRKASGPALRKKCESNSSE